MRTAWLPGGPRRTEEGYLVPAGAAVPRLVGNDPQGGLMVGRNATVQGGISHAGSVTLSLGARVQGPVAAGGAVVVGPKARVEGPVTAQGRVVVQEGAVVEGDVRSGADALLLGACQVGHVEAQGDIVIVGSPRALELRPGGRVTVRPF